MLIAVAVLAIGIAFNLVGKVNFGAVIALSIAIPLLAIGFAKVHKILKEVGFDAKKDSINFIIAITAISVGITASSWILSMVSPLTFTKFFTVTFLALTFSLLAPSIYKFMMAFKDMSWSQLVKAVVAFPLILPAIALGLAFASWALQLIKPIGLMQFLTAVGIALVFAVVSFGIRKMLKSFQGLDMKDVAKAVIFLPLILPAIALGLALSSYALQLVRPIGFIQFLTAVGIAIVFSVVAFGIRKMLKAFEGLSPRELIAASFMIPILLVAVSMAIAASSFFLSKTTTISFAQFLTAVGIAAVFVVISYGIAKIANGIRKMNYADLPKIPVFFVLVSIAIMLSSHILNKTASIEFTKIIKIGLFGVALAAIMFVMSKSIDKLGKINPKDLLMGSLAIVVISLAIMLSSHIFAAGDYGNYPGVGWTLGVALSMIAFIPAILVLGTIAMSGFGALAILAGSGMVLVVAATIVATSYILAMGKYSSFPSLEWSTSVALSMGAFTVGMVFLGGLILASFGLGAVALAAGSEAVLMVAQTIVDTSFVLSKGRYTGGPTKEWSEGIAIALGAFSPVYGMLMDNAIFSIFGGGGIGPKEFTEAIMTVSQGIVDAAGFFANNEAAFVKGPPKAWAEGVGLAIGAFAPVYQVLADNSGWMSSGVSVEDMKNAILTISRGIVDAAYFFAENTSPFKEGNYPSKSWGEGVGAALGAFAPVFQALHEDTGWFTSGDDVVNNMTKAIKAISYALVVSARMFSGVKEEAWKSYPTAEWSGGVKEAINSFIGVYKSLAEEDTEPEDLNLVSEYAQQLANTAAILGRNKKYFDMQIDPNFVKKMSKNIMDYTGLVKSLSGFKSSSIATMLGMDPVQNVANGMVKIATAYDKLARAIKGFSSALNGLDPIKVSSFTRLTGNIAMLSAMDSAMFSNMLKVLESRSGVFANMLKMQEDRAGARPTVKAGGVGGAIQGGKKGEDTSYLKDRKGETQLQKLDKMIELLSKISIEVDGLDTYLQSMNKNSGVGSNSSGDY
jgi:hypothetical protein